MIMAQIMNSQTTLLKIIVKMNLLLPPQLQFQMNYKNKINNNRLKQKTLIILIFNFCFLSHKRAKKRNLALRINKRILHLKNVFFSLKLSCIVLISYPNIMFFNKYRKGNANHSKQRLRKNPINKSNQRGVTKNYIKN